uniref:Uncharacterized protein n=1 Tax=Romanomermis culicivorax TaxID=13658 RepID=A0A915KMR3_ROMCU
MASTTPSSSAQRPADPSKDQCSDLRRNERLLFLVPGTVVIAEVLIQGHRSIHCANVNGHSNANTKAAEEKSVICVAVAIRPEGAAGVGRADASVDGGSFAIFKSKIGISNCSSSAGFNVDTQDWAFE